MTAQEWDERFKDTSVPVRCCSRTGRLKSQITITAGFPRDHHGVSDVFVHGFGRVPLNELEVVAEDEARAAFLASAEADLQALAAVRALYPVAELERAHRDLNAQALTLRELHAHAQAVAAVYCRWQGDVYAD